MIFLLQNLRCLILKKRASLFPAILVLSGSIFGSVMPADPSPSYEHPVFFANNGVHIDIGVRSADFLRSSQLQWDHWPILKQRRYLLFGWGDATFLAERDTWDTVSLGDIWTAAFSSPASAVRIVMRAHEPGPEELRITLCDTSWKALVAKLDASLKVNSEGRPVLLKAQFEKARLLFQSPLRYRWDYNCNHWVADILTSLNLPTPWLSSRSSSIMSTLRSELPSKKLCQNKPEKAD